jgi:hypothetical protein
MLQVPLPSDRGTLPVAGGVFRHVGGTKNLHEDLAPTHRNIEVAGDPVSHLRYIDDLLLLDQDAVRLAKSMAIAMELLQQQMGLQLKLSKGNLYPSQRFTCLGITWDTSKLTCHMSAKRTKALQHTARRLLKLSTPTDGADVGSPVQTRYLPRFVGQVVSTSRAIRPAKRRLLHIQHTLSKAVRRRGWNGKTTVYDDAEHSGGVPVKTGTAFSKLYVVGVGFGSMDDAQNFL